MASKKTKKSNKQKPRNKQNKQNKTKKKSNKITGNPECKSLTFNECEIVLLQNAVEELEKEQGRQMLNQPHITEIINLVESFLRSKKRICYGGTAINDLLPKQDQFYDKTVEFPDYDFYSPSPIKDAKELADKFAKSGYSNVEAKAGLHFGTYKIFVDFIPVADITQLPLGLYRRLQQETVVKDRIHYAPPNFLRMGMYMELSRPRGAVKRWEKVLTRLKLLNKHYPYITPDSVDCTTKKGKISNKIEIQRKESELPQSVLKSLYKTLRKTLIDQHVVFFGAYAHQLYSRYMPSSIRRKNTFVPDFDVLSENPKSTAEEIQKRIKELNDEKDLSLNIEIIEYPSIGELLPEHLEIRVENETVCFIYKPLACHSFNTIHLQGHEIRVATIDTLLSFYLAFYYINRKNYDEKRILCMSDFLFRVQERNRLAQKGVLKRFTMNCYGKQDTIRDARAKKSEKYRELKQLMRERRLKNEPINDLQEEFEKWFLKYIPTSPSVNRTKKLTVERIEENGIN